MQQADAISAATKRVPIPNGMRIEQLMPYLWKRARASAAMYLQAEKNLLKTASPEDRKDIKQNIKDAQDAIAMFDELLSKPYKSAFKPAEYRSITAVRQEEEERKAEQRERLKEERMREEEEAFQAQVMEAEIKGEAPPIRPRKRVRGKGTSALKFLGR